MEFLLGGDVRRGCTVMVRDDDLKLLRRSSVLLIVGDERANPASVTARAPPCPVVGFRVSVKEIVVRGLADSSRQGRAEKGKDIWTTWGTVA